MENENGSQDVLQKADEQNDLNEVNEQKNEQKNSRPKRKWKKRTKILVAVGVVLAVIGATAFGIYEYSFYKARSLYTPYEVTDEKFEEIAPENATQAEKIAAMPEYGADDTWAFYVYIVGSNLESCGLDEMSDLAKILTKDEAEKLYTAERESRGEDIRNFIQEVTEKGVDVPRRLYNPVDRSDEEVEENNGVGGEGSASKNILQMLSSDLGDKVQIIIQTGGSRRWENVSINPNRSQRFLISRDGMEKIYDSSIVNMAEKETLVDFLKYCRTNYKADHEVVMFWNHGGGIHGYGVDEIYGYKMMSVPDIAEAFAEAVGTPDRNNPYFEAIGFDACLMASLETADYLSGFAKYLYASEEVEPASGWDYTAFLNALSEHPSMNGVQLGKVLADSFIRQAVVEMSEYGVIPAVTFSVVDLSRVGDVYDAYGEFASAALKETLANPYMLSKISRAASESVSYASNQYDIYNTIDLGGFMGALPEELKGYGDKVMERLDDCVLYSRCSTFMEGSRGLSVYYPQHVTTGGISIFLEYINTVSKNKDINALYYYKIAGCLNDEYDSHVRSKGYGTAKTINYSIMEDISKIPVQCLGDGNLKLDLDEKLVGLTQDVMFGLAEYDEESGDIIYYGEDVYADISEDGHISTFFDGKWITFGGVPLELEVVSSTSEAALFKSNITYNFCPAYMLIAFNAQEDSVSLLGIGKRDDEATLERNLMQPETGDIIVVEREAGNIYDSTSRTDESMVVFNNGIRLEEKPLKNGSYLQYIMVKDLRSDAYSSQIASFKVSSGKISEQSINEELISYDKD